MPQKKRQQIVQDFQRDPDCRRIGRAHRLGQQRPVHAYALITIGTIEESLLATLAAKRELALAALDPDSDLDRVELAGGMDDLQRRLELLLGAKPEAPLIAAERAQHEQAIQATADRTQRIAHAGERLAAAALDLLGELLAQPESTPGQTLRTRLAQAIDTDPAGRPVLTVPLPDRAALDGLVQAFAGFKCAPRAQLIRTGSVPADTLAPQVRSRVSSR